MKPRFYFGVAALFLMQGSAAQDVPDTITLRALLDCIDEAAQIAEAAAVAAAPRTTPEARPELRLTLPSRMVELWLEAASFLQPPDPEAGEAVEAFPPGLKAALKEEPELRMKQEHLQLSLDRLRKLAADRATPGEAPEARRVAVPKRWVDEMHRARREFALQRIDDYKKDHRGELAIIRQEAGTFFRNSAGQLARVANGDIPEESEVYCAPFGKDGTWNLYQMINRPATWLQADAEAAKMPAPFGDPKVMGHLVSIHSYPENQFVLRMIRGIPQCWIGLNDRRLEADLDPMGAWEWSSGEPVTYWNWKSGEPNGSGQAQRRWEEDGVLMYSGDNTQANGYWGDFPDGSVEPRNHRYPCVVEWSVRAPAPIEGARLFPAFFSEELPGPGGDDGAFGMRVVYGGSRGASLRSARESHLSGKGRAVETKVPFLHHRDPDSADYLLIIPDAAPFPEQKENAVDTNVTFTCRGRIRVPEAGTYTFGVTNDDGFALRLKGNRWKQASGLGVIDPGDPATLLQFWHGPGRTLGVIALPAGDHELEFFGFQGTGAGFFELFAAKGEFERVADTDTWRVVGHRSRGALATPGIAAPGWTIETTPPGSLSRVAYDAAERALERNGRKEEAAAGQVDYRDPDDGGELVLEGSQPFPGGVPGEKDEQFAFRARGVLEIPADGIYWLGYHAVHGGRLTVRGQKWKRVVLAGPSPATIDEDILEHDPGAKWGSRVVGEIELKAGQYEIEFLSAHGAGAAALEVHGGTPQTPMLHLRAGAAKVGEDPAGLQLVR